MRVIAINNDPNHSKAFLTLPLRLYKDNKYWIRPLDKDIEKVFDASQNKLFKHGVCMRWLLINNEDITIGRVAAFVNFDTANKDNDQPTGGMGFFECIEDQEAAFLLFDTCREWLKQQGMEAMDGPINFGDRNSWWGLLVDGYDKEPLYTMDYHLPYYRQFFETYGFETYFKQFTYGRPVSDKKTNMHPLVMKAAQRIFDDPDYEFLHMKKSNWKKYAEDFRLVYNKAWVNHAGIKEMSKEQAINLFKTMKPIIEEDLIWFGYYKGEPVTFFLSLPELNQLFKYVDGKMNIWGKIKFLYHRLLRTNKKMIGVVFGVVPEHQSKGVESAVAMAFARIGWQPNFRYEAAEFNWIGDFNPKMMRVCQLLDAHVIKTHITYRYLFDRNKEFKRYPIIN